MIVYILTFLSSLLLFGIVSPRLKTQLVDGKALPRKKRFVLSKFRIAIFLSSIPPMFISAVRYYVGTDYLGTYYTGFYRILDGSVIDGFEPGFYALNRVIQLFSDNAFLLFIITAIIFVGMVYKAIEDISIDVPLSIILFFVSRYYFIGMNGVRQFIGLGFLMYSLRYVFEKKPKEFGFFVFLATLFHYTSILFIPVYFASKLRLSIRQIIIMIVGLAIFFRVGIFILLKALEGTKYGLLVDKFELAGIKFTLFTIALNAIIFLIGHSGLKRMQNDSKYCTCVNIQFIAFLVTLTLQSIPLVERVYWIFSFPIIVTFPYLLKGIKGKELRMVVKWGIVAIFAVYMMYDICVLKDHEVLPYKWIFGKEPIHYSGWEWYGGFKLK